MESGFLKKICQEYLNGSIVDKARSREYGGTGLGLAIAQEIIHLHNGTITINSKVNQGTEVIIKLPATAN